MTDNRRLPPSPPSPPSPQSPVPSSQYPIPNPHAPYLQEICALPPPAVLLAETQKAGEKTSKWAVHAFMMTLPVSPAPHLPHLPHLPIPPSPNTND
ncbi:hypothetical protein NIES4103_21930 [Nostoc sp. NIES-4103]|nr:hypothetical protein NIES4103_21930 [Nostoc sp. NIES-4103]